MRDASSESTYMYICSMLQQRPLRLRTIPIEIKYYQASVKSEIPSPDADNNAKAIIMNVGWMVQWDRAQHYTRCERSTPPEFVEKDVATKAVLRTFLFFVIYNKCFE
jgi:hypothetical protein